MRSTAKRKTAASPLVSVRKSPRFLVPANDAVSEAVHGSPAATGKSTSDESPTPSEAGDSNPPPDRRPRVLLAARTARRMRAIRAIIRVDCDRRKWRALVRWHVDRDDALCDSTWVAWTDLPRIWKLVAWHVRRKTMPRPAPIARPVRDLVGRRGGPTVEERHAARAPAAIASAPEGSTGSCADTPPPAILGVDRVTRSASRRELLAVAHTALVHVSVPDDAMPAHIPMDVGELASATGHVRGRPDPAPDGPNSKRIKLVVSRGTKRAANPLPTVRCVSACKGAGLSGS
jgi:hypothetical protein